MDHGTWIMDHATCIMHHNGSWKMHLGSWIIEHASWIMDHGTWIMDHGSWNMDHGTWIMDHAVWTYTHFCKRASNGTKPRHMHHFGIVRSQDPRNMNLTFPAKWVVAESNKGWTSCVGSGLCMTHFAAFSQPTGETCRLSSYGSVSYPMSVCMYICMSHISELFKASELEPESSMELSGTGNCGTGTFQHWNFLALSSELFKASELVDQHPVMCNPPSVTNWTSGNT